MDEKPVAVFVCRTPQPAPSPPAPRESETLFPSCTHCDVPGNPTTRCPLAATYIILAPPMAAQMTPTPVWLVEEPRTIREAQRRPTPLYCQRHAYERCHLPLPPQALPF